MANKINSKVETNKINSKVSGQQDNTGKEIQKQGPTIDSEVGEVVSIETPTTLSDEQYNAVIEQGKNIVKAMLLNDLEKAVYCVETNERGAWKKPLNEHGAQKYNDVSEWLKSEIGLEVSVKTINNYAKAVHIFAVKDKDGHYTMDDKYKAYSIQKLDEIQRLPDFKTRNDLERYEKDLGIYPEMSVSTLRGVLSDYKESQLTSEQKEKREAKKEEAKQKREAKKNEVETLTHKVETLKDDKNLMREFITRWFRYANDKMMSDKDFRAKYIEAVKEISKYYSDILEERKEETK